MFIQLDTNNALRTIDNLAQMFLMFKTVLKYNRSDARGYTWEC